MKRKNFKKPMISALEQRILFDGAAVATAVDVLDESSFSSNNNTQTTTNSNDVTQNNAENSVHEAQAVQGFERPRREVAFVDVTVSDYQTLVDGVGEGVEVYLVSSLDDINSILKSETNIDAIHILSHGNVGEITVGNDVLNQNTLNSFDAVLQTMKNSLSENGDILLYGCNVASDGSGQEFINTFAQITKADVAASNDITGSSELGGDWDLEVSNGNIETDSFVIENYDNKLGTVNVLVFSKPNMNGSDSSPGTADESANLASIVKYFINGTNSYANTYTYYDFSSFSVDSGLTSFSDPNLSAKLNSSSFLFMPDMESGFNLSTDLPSSAKTILADWVNAGGVMMMTGTYGSLDVDFLNTIFGWDLTSQSGSSWSLNTANAVGTPFDGGPASLTGPSLTDSIGKGTVTGFKTIYGTDSNATVAVIDKGQGKVIFLGYDFYSAGISGTGFTSTSTQFGADVTTGSTAGNDWVQQIVPRALQYSAILSGAGDVNEDEPFTFSSDSFKEGSTILSKIKITSLPAHGTLTLLNTTVTLNQEIISSDYIHLKYTPTSNYNGTDTFNWQGWSTTNSTYSADVNYNITVTGVNDAPVATVASFTTNEDTLYSGILSVTDIDSSSFTYSINTNASHGTVTITNASTGAYSYTPASNYNGTDSFIFAVSDGTSISTATVDITVNPVNDKPTIESTTTTINYTEHDLPVIVSPSVIIGDIDSTTISSATVSITSSFTTGDVLNFTNDNSTSYGNISASYNATTGILTLSSSDSSATMTQWKNALENIKFSISSTIDVVNNGTRTISWKVNDGLLDSLIDTSTINVQGYGSMPYIYGTDKVTVNEDNSLSLSGFVVGDTDTTVLTVSVVSQHGNLSLGTTTGITGYSSATKTLEITGTSADLQNALNSMVYTPDANYNGLDELVIKASDDSGKSWIDYYVSRTGLFYNPTNQHYYEFVSTPLTWDAAKTAAESRTYLGLGGYLATVTSAEENALIASKLGGNGWMGASDAANEGTWIWVGGPEIGQTVSFNGWNSGEPNNSGNEDAAQYIGSSGKWNDLPNTYGLNGYVVEYGGLSTDATSKPAAAKLNITVVPVNDLPVISVDSGNSASSSLTETNTTLSSSGTLNVLDVDTPQTVSVSTVSVVASGVKTGLVSTNTQLLAMLSVDSGNIIDSSSTTGIINWTFDSGNEAFNYLATGETLTLTYTITATDDNGTPASDTQTVVITITGTNDTPNITVDSGNSASSSLIETNTTLTSSGTLNVVDLDRTDVITTSHVVSSVQKDASGNVMNTDSNEPINSLLKDMLSITHTPIDGTTQTGVINWTFDSGNEAFNYLATGETLTLTYTITATDDNGTPASDTQTVVITITGTNDTPNITVDSGNSASSSLIETNTTLTSSGTLNVVDLDRTDVITTSHVVSSVQKDASGNVMNTDSNEPINSLLKDMLSITHTPIDGTTQTGVINWTFDSGNEAFNYLATGETLTLTYTITATDDNGTPASDTQTVVITITGTNDTPNITVDSGNSASSSLIETNTTLTSSGTLNVVDLDRTDVITTSHVVSSVQKDASGNVMNTDSNEPINSLLKDMLSITHTPIDGTTQTGVINWTFDSGNEAFNYLATGETLTLTYTITATDDNGTPASDTQTVVITITGTNDTPNITVDSGNSASSSLIETNTTLTSSGTLNVVDLDRTDVITTSHVVSSVQKDASGNVMNTDSNEPINSLLKDMLSITHTPIDGTTQTGVINWTFDSGNEAFNYLATGETLTLTYTITATDDNGTPASDTQTVVITITGTNDTPTVSLENIDDKTPFGKEFTKETAYLFSDLDTTDVFNFEAVNLPRGLIIDSRTGIISGAPVESGIFEVTLKITDSGTPTLGVTRTFSLLVIAPPQPEVAKTITPPSVVEPLSTNNEIKLSNYSSTNNNLGVLNFGTNNGVSIDPGNGYLDTGSKNAPVDAQATVSKANSTSEQASQSNSQSSSSSVNNDAKGIIQANVDLNVTNDGQVKFNDNNNNLAMSSVGITIEDIKINNNLIELKIADTNPGQNYVVSQANGEALPVGIIFDPRTGSIKGTIPENLNELSLSIKAVNADGTTRVLNLKIDLKQFKQKPQAELNEKYIGLKEQLAFENEKLEGYGTYLTKLFA